MTRVEKVVKNLHQDLENKSVLEVACGCAEFSIAASKVASHVDCIDLDSFRLRPEITQCANLHFQAMDATAMTFPDGSFNTVVLYNAIGHLEHILESVIQECLRVLRQVGNVYIISSFKLDQAVIRERLLPMLAEKGIKYAVEEKLFTYVRISK